MVQKSYTKLGEIARDNGFGNCDGIIFDLGMSSWHIEESGRGFSFQRDEPLDMRYNWRSEVGGRRSEAGGQGSEVGGRRLETAAEIVNQYTEEKLTRIIKEYGEERFARPIAKQIIKARKEKPIVSTFQLVEVIKEAVPRWYRRGRRLHFATKTFQALRIAVNHELENIEGGLEQAVQVLRSQGRLAVISFHSLEDRIVKNFLRQQAKRGVLRILTKKPIRAALTEISQNPRARSAKLRAAEKIVCE
ncbi:MAG: 16S rRNA (cytosine(1402)-N(4))-methyltransferase RsmH [Parcubacteria group bacterium]|nr:16S rRNA (cytosine(1402)-N(4))-methyltransferase RsmH [Parcubacteria group bacterium]